jgi:hypothetical protein
MPTRDEIQTFFEEHWPEEEFLLADGFEDAFLGVAYGKMREPVACYDRKKCISILMSGGMSEEEAEEFFGFNTEDAWVGEKTPVFIDSMQR